MSSLCLKVARETNEELRNIKAFPSEGFDVGAILSIARRYRSSLYFTCPSVHTSSLEKMCSKLCLQWYPCICSVPASLEPCWFLLDVSFLLSYDLWVRSLDCYICWLIRQLSSKHDEATRIEALHWISTLLNRHRTEVTIIVHFIFLCIHPTCLQHI